MEQFSPPNQWNIPQPRVSFERQGSKPAEKLYHAMGDYIQDSVNRLRLSAKHNPLGTFVAQAEDLLTINHNIIAATRERIDAIGGLNLGRAIRMDLYEKLLPQLLFLPGLFSYRATNKPARELREHLINHDSVYGLVADYLPATIHQFDQDNWSNESAELVGSINELTTLGMYSRSQDANRTALPTLPKRDEYRKIDVQYYSYIDDGPRYANLQVKSSKNAEKRVFGIRTLTGADLGNSATNQFWPPYTKMQTARAIIQEVNGLATDEQIATLDRVESHINTIAIAELGAPFNLIKRPKNIVSIT